MCGTFLLNQIIEYFQCDDAFEINKGNRGTNYFLIRLGKQKSLSH